MNPARKPHPPRMTPYAVRRPRKYLHQEEVERMAHCARQTGRHGHRDATLIWFLYRHGLRGSEARALTWKQIDLTEGLIFIARRKNGLDSTQRLSAYERGALLILRRESPPGSSHVFSTDRGTPLSHTTLYKIVARAGRLAGLPLPVNPHMLRHACGFHLVNVRKADTRRVQEFLGHRDIKHTVRYTELDDHKFDGLWDDEDP